VPLTEIGFSLDVLSWGDMGGEASFSTCSRHRLPNEHVTPSISKDSYRISNVFEFRGYASSEMTPKGTHTANLD